MKSKVVAGETLPAWSIWRTPTLLGPSATLNDALHEIPSVEYSTRAPLSRPATASVPSEVIRSLALLPLSLRSDTSGALGAVESTMNSYSLGWEMLPARSICRRRTRLVPSAAMNVSDQVTPSSMEYSTAAPASTVELVPVISTRKPVGPPPLETTKSSVLIPATKPPVTENGAKALYPDQPHVA